MELETELHRNTLTEKKSEFIKQKVEIKQEIIGLENIDSIIEDKDHNNTNKVKIPEIKIIEEKTPEIKK